MDPLSLGIANSKADIDDVSIILFFSWLNINKLNWATEVSFFVEGAGELSAKNKSVLVTFLAKDCIGEGVSSFVKILFSIFGKVHVKKGLSLGWWFLLDFAGLA